MLERFAGSIVPVKTNRILAVSKRKSRSGLINWWKGVIFLLSNWNQLWIEYLNIDSNVQFTLTKVKYQWR
jgi:hypothetical protein